jgi:hypothetical protein
LLFDQAADLARWLARAPAWIRRKASPRPKPLKAFGHYNDFQTWRIFMKSKMLCRLASAVMVLLPATGTCTIAQDPTPRYFRGVLNDYTPASTVTPTGPWEISGPWSLKLNHERTKADFSAAVTMTLSDYSRNPSNVDTPGGRMEHTHNISIDGGTVTLLSTGGFEVTGPVTVTKNGGPVPFGASSATVTVTGGEYVEFSNITLTFQGGAIVHFGPQAINGVVRSARAFESNSAH